MPRLKQKQQEKVEYKSKFIQIVERSLDEANWTKQQFMAEIQLGESQYYRWSRGENIPTKAIVNRIAVFLSRRLDTINQSLPHAPFPNSDVIDGLLNELLDAAGYSASIKGKGANSSWEEISNNRSWRVGYSSFDDPKWAIAPEKYGDPPSGLAIELAERVGDLLGVNTEWQYLSSEEMPLAISERRVHCIAPFMLAAPGRFFNYKFSDPWRQVGSFHVAVVGIFPNQSDDNLMLEDLSGREIQLLYIPNEIGSWVVNILGRSYKKKSFSSRMKAVSYLKDFHESHRDQKDSLIPVFCSDISTCEKIAKENNWKTLKIRRMEKVELYPAFAFHPEEEKLAIAVNSIIGTVSMLPPL